MERVTGNTWHITTQEEFWETCEFAKAALAFAARLETDQVRWFFAGCYANWVEQRFTVLCQSFAGAEYSNHQLSISVTRDAAGHYQFERLYQSP